MARSSLCELESPRAGERLAWADIAKAISIILLVAWTVIGDEAYFNEMLLLLRMPLFFFVSGLFAHRILTQASLRELATDRVGNLLYLYALWCVLLFLSRDAVMYVLWEVPQDPMRLLTIFWDVNFAMWFLYALAVSFAVAWAVRHVPVWIVLAASIVLYIASVTSGEWRWLPFVERIVRLFPFFWLGLIAMPFLRQAVERHYRLWPLAVGLYLALAWAVFDSELRAFGPLTFLISIIGIVGTLGFARAVATFGWSWPLTIVGASTLYIYVMQRTILFYLERGLSFLGIDFAGIDFVKIAVVVVVAAVFGRVAMRYGLTRWLFQAPWVGREAGRRGNPLASGSV